MQQTATSIDRRKFPRLVEEHTMALKFVPNEAEETRQEHMFFHLAKDVSRGGLRFHGSGNIVVNSRVRIHIALKDPLRTVTHTGTVRWVKRLSPTEPFSIGVEFMNQTDGDRQLWGQYLQERIHV